MSRLLLALICMLASFSLASGAVAHVAEQTICVESSAAAHSGDEGNKAPDIDSSGKGVQHQHAGCHGHHCASLANDMAPRSYALLDDGRRCTCVASLAGATPDPSLRPPQA
ncbi:hypothetical protein DAH66_16075 [Sphingomonas koreensis]|uniref:DUF2946 domain-containing protein n=1 Tax=Sphingomonas koreensis TaxID=93064 RepID=A0A430G0Y0_9SPHN|nr:hypothetical protein [Sphingomonas koreensis]RSY80270.1 hypothetical protein DAH66_16075 [Sphingomonas koreensis]